MQCLYCQKKLGMFASKKRPFCSKLHEDWYQDEQSGSAVRRLLEPFPDDDQPVAQPALAEPPPVPLMTRPLQAPSVPPPPSVSPPPIASVRPEPVKEPPALLDLFAQAPSLIPPPPPKTAEPWKEMSVTRAALLPPKAHIPAIQAAPLPIEAA